MSMYRMCFCVCGGGGGGGGGRGVGAGELNYKYFWVCGYALICLIFFGCVCLVGVGAREPSLCSKTHAHPHPLGL